MSFGLCTCSASMTAPAAYLTPHVKIHDTSASSYCLTSIQACFQTCPHVAAGARQIYLPTTEVACVPVPNKPPTPRHGDLFFFENRYVCCLHMNGTGTRCAEMNAIAVPEVVAVSQASAFRRDLTQQRAHVPHLHFLVEDHSISIAIASPVRRTDSGC